MTFHRPRINRKDKNHAKVITELGQMLDGWQKLEVEKLTHPAWVGMCKGESVTIIDVSSFGGLMTDTICIIRQKALFVEIKDIGKRNDLTDAEAMLKYLHPELFKVVETSDEYYQVILAEL